MVFGGSPDHHCMKCHSCRDLANDALHGFQKAVILVAHCGYLHAQFICHHNGIILTTRCPHDVLLYNGTLCRALRRIADNVRICVNKLLLQSTAMSGLQDFVGCLFVCLFVCFFACFECFTVTMPH